MLKNKITEIVNNINLLSILNGFFCSLFILAPIFSNRVIDLFGMPILMSAITMQLAYATLDLINNNFGPDKAKQTLLSAILMRFIIWIIIGLLMLLPTYKMTSGFEGFVLDSFKLMLAGWFATGFSQYFIDIPIFNYVKTRLKYNFIARYNISNFISLLLAAILFNVIAFFGTDMPILKLTIMAFVIQVIMTIVLSPLMGLINKLIEDYRRRNIWL